MAQGQYHWQDALGASEHIVNFLDFESGQVTTLFKEEGFIPWADLAVSPDEEWILYGKYPVPVSELMLMENLRSTIPRALARRRSRNSSVPGDALVPCPGCRLSLSVPQIDRSFPETTVHSLERPSVPMGASEFGAFRMSGTEE